MGGVLLMRPNIKEFEELSSIIGLMTLSWGWADYVLSYIIATIIQQTGTIHGHPEPPVSLKKRVKALRRALRDVPILQPFKEEGTLLAERFLEIGNRRNNLVHSAAIQTHKGTFEALSLKVKEGRT